MDLILATNNKHKIREFERILTPLDIRIISLSEAGISVSPEENADTFEGNAYIKVKAVFDICNRHICNEHICNEHICNEHIANTAVVADDSGLEVYALNNAPGVFSARYGGEGLTDKQRYEKLLVDMRDIPEENRGARFVCSISLILSAEKHYTFTGVCEGKIGFSAMGDNGFGYDPIFLVGVKNESLALLDGERKDKISHRGAALKKMAEALSEIKL